ncbi:poly(hydroxyalkanoate) inclusion protein PhaP [Psychrobacillus insolitus]|uniref:Poly(Hydroxyalkanoate) inclusion protein PhaP n=1 Tax=Psychrobacillus insolitus TaxID=1461 RepID=A0A2W7N503_9BACI|nr:PhaP protein [Psychrobacillus insolitus]PZX04512.1 poly(hydroxyalkanoate) inclusion protein PhaP [Psychrobacillus insolitus]
MMKEQMKEQVANGVDLIWDGWLNSFKTIQNFQDDVQKKTLQAFTAQKELLDSSVSTFKTIEEESKKAAIEWQEKIQNSFKEINNGPLANEAAWLTNIQEINEKVQTLSWKPNTTMLELILQSQNQWESTVKTALEQQKQERVQVLGKIEEVTEELKEAHKGLLVTAGV